MLQKESVLMLHNYYQTPGGEDVSMQAEVEVLKSNSHNVEILSWHNNSINDYSLIDKTNLIWKSVWNPESKETVYGKLKESDFDILHVQNFFPLISPSVYSAARNLSIPIVQHLRNFRLGCLNGYLYRNQGVCEQCIGHNPWRGVWHQCYRNSLASSFTLWQLLTVHRFRQTWFQDVDLFITPSQFSANKLIEIGLPENRLKVKPNCVVDPLKDSEIPSFPQSPSFMFVGRLSKEKGILELLKAWRLVNQPEWQLWIVGGGSQSELLKTYCQEHQLANVQFLGYRSPPE
ncbi:MAG: glycosyltransferase family 4 protein, partial [Cyanobacteria bacterium J06649_11]